LLAAHGHPVLTSSLILAGQTEPITDAHEAAAQIGKRVDLVIDAGAQSLEPTTVIDLTGETPEIVRVGRGPVDRMA
jgi:tRNA A37 threonylcarbamoyladenosine synthetase subunit TsaC/SUA5/YrdC